MQKKIDARREQEPAQARRIHAFANFFKNYMTVSAVIAAALPIPAASFRLIPTYPAQTKLLSTYTSLFCFLTLAYIFFNRHAIARRMFPEYFGEPFLTSGEYGVSARFTITDRIASWLRRRRQVRPGTRLAVAPLFLILVSIVFSFCYHEVFARSVSQQKSITKTIQTKPDEGTDPFQLHSYSHVSDGSLLLVCYLGIFVTAEAAFILMAIKEYMQDILGLTDTEIIRGPMISGPSRAAVVPGLAGSSEPGQASMSDTASPGE
jgi:hypothetical protein